MHSNYKKLFKTLLKLLFIILVLLFLGYILFIEFIYPRTHFDIIKKEASNNYIDPYLVLSVIKTESGFDTLATSNKKAKGLMQIMDSTANDVIKKINLIDNIDNLDLYDINTNISIGCKYLSYLINHYNGNYYLAICAYNAGMGNVDRWIENGYIDRHLENYIDINVPFNETKKYLKKVIDTYKIYRFLY